MTIERYLPLALVCLVATACVENTVYVVPSEKEAVRVTTSPSASAPPTEIKPSVAPPSKKVADPVASVALEAVPEPAPKPVKTPAVRTDADRPSPRADGLTVHRPFATIETMARQVAYRTEQAVSELKGSNWSALVKPAATPCIPEAVAKSIGAQLRRSLKKNSSPDDEMLKAVVGEQGKLQLLDFEPTATDKLRPPNMVLMLDWEPRPDNNWKLGKVTSTLMGLRNDGPVKAGGTVDAWTFFVMSSAPCRPTKDRFRAVASCECANKDDTEHARRFSALECAKVTALTKIADRFSFWEKDCKIRTDDGKLTVKECEFSSTGVIRSGDVTAKHFDSHSCVANVEYVVHLPDEIQEYLLEKNRIKVKRP